MPMIPKMTKNRSDTTTTLRMLGIALNRACIAIFNNLTLLMSLNGRKTLSNRNILMIYRPYTDDNERERIERHTIEKSMRFQGFLR